jgi:hypothetical protein
VAVLTVAAGLTGSSYAEAAGVKCSSSLAYVPGAPPRCEQWRYTRETVALTHASFAQRKQDFTINGCNADAPQSRGCVKPYPYNQFDWTTDGCSGPTGLLPPFGAWTDIFREPCELHDFGYRNFGKGLRLQPTPLRRYSVDRMFRREMRRICATWVNPFERATCRRAAQTMYTAVVTYPGNYWGFF